MVKKGKGTKSTKSVAIEEIKEIPNTLKVKRKSAKKIIDEDEIPEENQPAIESGNEDSDVEELSDDAEVADEDEEAEVNESDDDDEESNENSDVNDIDKDSENEGEDSEHDDEDSEHDGEDSEHDGGDSDNDDEKMNDDQGKKKSKKRKAEDDDSDMETGKKSKDDFKDIFIGNISFKADEASIKDLFESMDITVESVRIIADRDGKPKGFGYLTTTAEDAEKVLEMTDVEFDGRTLRFDNAAPKRTPGSGRGSERGGRGNSRGGRGNSRGGRGSSRGGRGDGRDHNNTPSKLLLVKNLSYDTDSNSLLRIFKGASDVRVLKDRDTGRSRGLAFVEYDTKEAAVAANKAKSGQEIDGREVNIVYAVPREDFNGADGGGRGRGRGRDGFRGGRGRGRGSGRGGGRGRGGHR